MKRLQITTILLFIGITANAQFKVGGKLAYGSKIKSLGIGGKAIYEINEKLSVSGELNYFFGSNTSKKNSIRGISLGTNSSTSLVTLNTDLHYNLNIPSFNLYALGGLNFSFANSKGSYSYGGSSFSYGGFTGFTLPSGSSPSLNQTFIGLNLGLGGLIPINNNLDFFSEVKYIINDFGQIVISAGVLYKIN